MCADRFLGENYPDSPEGLTQEIQKIIDKNQVSGKELLMIDFTDLHYSATLDVEWEFDGVYQKEIKSGKHNTDIHFGYGYQEFDKHFDNLMNEAKYGVRLRTPFIDELISLGKTSLIEYCKKHTFYHYKPFSKTCDCHTCQTTGKITCSNCGGKGKKTCWGCGGSGNESYQVPVYDNKGTIRSYQTQYRSCSACFGSGKNKCGDCGGSGNIACQECGGQGIFTHIIKVSAIAEPYYGVYIDESYHLTDLQKFLNEKGMDFCAKKN
ncbi:Uncharacterised protein [Moraxella caprae]|uniref:Uncharacterized protein n=1 Tax=Moraxella caprae TaxID=90240 RepID=A0A378R168_9GAMM|nr:hypothetical protein [Moraxella caprae]STZ09066.1 Uncharacterised protein [Moraxella caprae]